MFNLIWHEILNALKPGGLFKETYFLSEIFVTILLFNNSKARLVKCLLSENTRSQQIVPSGNSEERFSSNSHNSEIYNTWRKT